MLEKEKLNLWSSGGETSKPKSLTMDIVVNEKNYLLFLCIVYSR